MHRQMASSSIHLSTASLSLKAQRNSQGCRAFRARCPCRMVKAAASEVWLTEHSFMIYKNGGACTCVVKLGLARRIKCRKASSLWR